MFYGWKLALLGSSGNFLLQGSTVYIMNAFIDPLNSLYGWTRSDISTIMSCAAIGGGLCMPLFSSLALHLPLKMLMTLGALIGGLSAIYMGITDNLFLFGLCFVLTWASGQAFGGVCANILINKWFNIYKGRAFGICNIGNSFAGAILPIILMYLIQYTNVKFAWITYGSIILCCVPLCLILIKEKPEDINLTPDNLPLSKSNKNTNTVECCTEISIFDTLKIKEVYYFGLIFGLMLMCASSVMSQLKLRFTDIGFNSNIAMLLMCSTALCSTIAKYLWGWLCDKFNPIIITRVLACCHILSLSFSFLAPTLINSILFAFTFGLSAGGSWSVMPSVVSYFFGKEKFICMYRVISPFVMLKALGFLIIGFSYTIFGTYNQAYILFISIFSISLLLSFKLNKNKNIGTN